MAIIHLMPDNYQKTNDSLLHKEYLNHYNYQGNCTELKWGDELCTMIARKDRPYPSIRCAAGEHPYDPTNIYNSIDVNYWKTCLYNFANVTDVTFSVGVKSMSSDDSYILANFTKRCTGSVDKSSRCANDHIASFQSREFGKACILIILGGFTLFLCIATIKKTDDCNYEAEITAILIVCILTIFVIYMFYLCIFGKKKTDATKNPSIVVVTISA
ncbi:MAG: hypothetical protein Hyperionvirus6_96 [Hyperionvirus sp.]|uniref:Uncharacterized protein n=1 Tax=Hyperionvirus sp. TaxID=2487770 RepID=A0A3G5A842_9VIRU|nr:MAG: hypothetical protein Hyperionvirus6_96 [Hyperionvirus sp.]